MPPDAARRKRAAAKAKKPPRVPLVLAPKARKEALKDPAKYEREAYKKLPEKTRREVGQKAVRKLTTAGPPTPGRAATKTEKVVAVEHVKRQREIQKRLKLGVDINVPLKKQSPEKQIAHALQKPTLKKQAQTTADTFANRGIRSALTKDMKLRFDSDPELRRTLRIAARGDEDRAFKRLPKDLQERVGAHRQAEFESSTAASKLGIDAPDVVKRGARTAASTTGNVARRFAKDPLKSTGQVVGGIAKTVPLVPLAIGKAIVEPVGTAKMIAEDYSQRYGEIWRNEPGAVKRQLKRLEKDGVFAETLDVASLFAPAAGTIAGHTVKGASKLNKGKVAAKMDAARPPIQVAGQTGRLRTQRTAHVRPVRILRQRGTDAARKAQHTRLIKKQEKLQSVPLNKRTPKQKKQLAALGSRVGSTPIKGTVRTFTSMSRSENLRKLAAVRGRIRPLERLHRKHEHGAEQKAIRELFGKKGSLIANVKDLDADQAAALTVAMGAGIRSTTPPAEASRLLNDYIAKVERKRARAKVERRKDPAVDALPALRAMAADPAAHFTRQIDELADIENARSLKIAEGGFGEPPAGRHLEMQSEMLGVGDPPGLKRARKLAVAENERRTAAAAAAGPHVKPKLVGPDHFMSQAAHIDRVGAEASKRGLAPGGYVSTSLGSSTAPRLRIRLTKGKPLKSKAVNIRRGEWLLDPRVNVRADQKVLQHQAGQGFLHDISEQFARRDLPGAEPIPAEGLLKTELLDRVYRSGLEASANHSDWQHWGVVQAPGGKDRWHLVPRDIENAARTFIDPPKAPERLWSGIATRWPSTLLVGTSPVWLGYQVLNNLGQILIGAPSAILHGRKNLQLLKGLTPEERHFIDLVTSTGPQHHMALSGERLATRHLGEVSKLTRLYEGIIKPRARDPFGLFRADHFQNTQARRFLAINDFRRRLSSMNDGLGDSAALLPQLKDILHTLDTPAHKLLDDETALHAYRQSTRIAEGVAAHTNKVLGDWTSFTPMERKILKNNVLFYGYLRFSLRLLFYTLPVEHPQMAGVLANLSRLQYEEMEELLGKAGILPYQLGKWYLKNGNEIAVNRLNPLSNVATELGLSGKPEDALRFVPPLLMSLLEAASGHDPIMGRDLTARDPVDGSEKKLTDLEGGEDWAARGKHLLNEILNLSAPARELRPDQPFSTEEGEPVARTDTSLPGFGEYSRFGADAIPYQQEKAAARGKTGLLERAGRFVVPLLPKPSTASETAAQGALRKKRQELTERRRSFAIGTGQTAMERERDIRRAEMRRMIYGADLDPKEQMELDMLRAQQEGSGRPVDDDPWKELDR